MKNCSSQFPQAEREQRLVYKQSILKRNVKTDVFLIVYKCRSSSIMDDGGTILLIRLMPRFLQKLCTRVRLVCVCLWVIYDVQVLFLCLPCLHTGAWKHVMACHGMSLGWNPTSPFLTAYPPPSAELWMCLFSYQVWDVRHIHCGLGRERQWNEH